MRFYIVDDSTPIGKSLSYLFRGSYSPKRAADHNRSLRAEKADFTTMFQREVARACTIE